MRLYKFLLFLAIIFLANVSFSQKNLDSLINVFENDSSIKNKLIIGEKIINLTINENDELSLKYATECKNIALNIKDSLNEVLFLDYLGEIYRSNGNYNNAISSLNNSIKIKNELKDKSTLHTSYNSLGKIYANIGQYDLSIRSFLDALYLMESEKNTEGQAFYLNNVGIVFDLQKMYDKALEYYLKSLKIKENNNMKDALAASYNNIAIVYYNLDKFKKSLFYHQKALKENIRMNKTKSIARSYNNIGFAYISLKNYNQAILNLRKALGIREELKDLRAVAQTKVNMATAFIPINLLDSAKIYANSGKQIANSIGAKEILDDSYQILAEIYEKQSNYKLAFTFYKKHAELQDTLRNSKAFASIAEMEAKYNLLKKEQEIQTRDFKIEKNELLIEEKESTIRFYIILIASFIIAISLLIFAYFQKRRISILLQGQNALIEKQNTVLAKEKSTLSSELKDKTDILDKVYSEKQNTELPPELLSLSKREMEVLSYLALGWTDNQLSEKLFVSKSTVKTHLRRIYSKLLVNGRAGAVTIAHKYNIIGGLDS